MEEHTCCMNVACRARIVEGEVKKGWGLRSGGFVILCHACGTAYEQLDFCNMFHIKETGWRECNSCGKQLHCGCIASRSFVALLDGGGVQCIGCMKNSELSTIPTGILCESSNKCPENEKENGFGEATVDYVYQSQLLAADPIMDVSAINKDIMDMRKPIECSGRSSGNGLFGNIKHEAVMLSIEDAGNKIFLNRNQVHQGPCRISKYDDSKTYIIDKGMHESLTQTCLDISLGTCNPNNVVETCYNTIIPKFSIPVLKGLAEERETNKAKSSFLQMQKSCNLLPKLPRITNGNGSETSRDMLPHLRVARPPGEGKGRNQLLPRYWPRITDQELQQISGNPNSTIVPLFEKVLSASDAGRIGRLVLPKACAEAYFPPISQPEGLPLKIQDAKGKDWIFQFRFWPNNYSRMYVLEGVTPCIHSMQLQAGDTVTFSRIDPEGKLVMGFRKATNSVPLQDSQITAIANVTLCSESYLSGVADKLPIVSGHPGLLQSPKGSADPPCNDFSRFNSWNNINIQGDQSIEEFQMQSTQVPEKRRGCNISSKSKRLHIGNEDALELKMTWEEVQDLLCPPPTAKPSIAVIDDREFEEYEEPPVLGKRTIFTAGTSGSHDQWVQCDNCSKWRRLPMDVVLSSKWSCADNIWDSKRSSCSVPDEMNPEVLQSFLQQSAGFRKRKIAAIYKPPLSELESSALASSTLLGEDGPGTSSIAATTKHPRHRPGCTCIVCIQPPSGKESKHKPSCTCNVCITVKRRFKTLMMRKKKHQSEQEEAEITKKLEWVKKNEIDADISFKTMIPLDTRDELESGSGTPWAEMGKGQIDLTCHPMREENQQVESSHVSMMSLLQGASLPLEAYLKQNGLASLVCKQQESSSSHAASQVPPGLSEGRMHDESCRASMSRELDSGADEGHGGSHQSLK